MKRIVAGFVVGLVVGMGVQMASANIPDGYLDLSDIDTDELLALCADALRNDWGRLILPEQE